MYDSDVSDEEWELIKHHFDPVDTRGGAGAKVVFHIGKAVIVTVNRRFDD